MKIVINKCYGGFGLSETGMMRYAEIKGITLYPERKHSYIKYYIVPPDQRIRGLGDAFYKMSLEQRQEHNEKYRSQALNQYEIERNDPALIQVIEELGESAYGAHAELSIVEIPDDVSWEIEEYDGKEWIAEEHRTWS